MMTRRCLLLALPALALGCRMENDFKIFGYSTKPPFDTSIRTVHVPVFKNTVLLTTPYRDLEVDVTSAVVKEINSRTPWKVSSNRDAADTELLGTITKIEKNILNRTQQNFARELEFVYTVSLVWRDLRTGAVLSNRSGQTPPLVVEPFDPSLPPPMPDCPRERAIPVVVVATARAIPELGESNATAMKLGFEQLARSIVNMMETPW